MSEGQQTTVRGRVSRTHRIGFDVLTGDGQLFAITPRRVRDPLDAPATGDWVTVATDTDHPDPVITSVQPRRTVVIRRDPADRALPQVLAANADVVAVVQGADRPVNARRLERQLAVAHGSGADVVIVITKADVDPGGEVAAQVAQAAPTEEVLLTAATIDQGIDEVDALTTDERTLVLLGESGGGKSSLVNAILGHEALATGGVREGDAKGRHTTTRRTLLPLATGGAVLDTPGVRAIGLWPGHADLDAVFTEVAEAALECRFSDCSHTGEPGCAVTAAADDDGHITPERLEAYLRLAEEVRDTEEAVRRQGWR